MERAIMLFTFLYFTGCIFAQNQIQMDPIKYKPFWSNREVKWIFKNYTLKPRKDLDSIWLKNGVYEFPDGKILLTMDYGVGPGTMYESEESLKAILNEPDIRKDGEHQLANLIPDDKEFLKQKEIYIQDLANQLNIPIEKLDRSLNSLRLIDRMYKKKPPANKIEFFNKDYLYLIAYLGEVYRKEVGGEWYFERKPGVESYIPYIKLKNGKKLDPWYHLFTELYEHYENFRIHVIGEFEAYTALQSLNDVRR